MIIKGKSRSDPSALAAHLGNTAQNERVTLLEARGTVAQAIRGALIEMDAYAVGTRCEKPLYHANIDPQPPHRLTREQIFESVDALEEKLGLVGHQRIIVAHEKYGREHFHVVWTRIDLDNMRSVSDSHNYRKHEEVARDLERRFGHERVQGAHHERDGVERPDRTPSRAELRQEERTGIKGKDVKRDVTDAFRSCDSPDAFRAALEDKGYILAQGDRRDYVVIDRAGGIHSLARRIDGMKAAELREFMLPMDRTSLPTTDQAREIALDKEQLRREAREDNMLEKAYGRGEDYVSQTTAALEDHKRRQPINDEPRPERPTENDGNAPADVRAGAKEQEKAEPRHRERLSSKINNGEVTDRVQRILDRFDSEDRDTERWDGGERDPDRQNEAPGGGRTRSR